VPATLDASTITRHAVRGLDAATAAEIRATRRAPGYGHPAHEEVGDDHAPCRVCLGPIEPGEPRLLVTHDPFAAHGTYPLPGPIFVHARVCAPFDGPGLPPVLREGARTLQAFGVHRQLVAEARVEDADSVALVSASLLADPGVEYLHVRSTGAGCWLARVERTG
jgi:hypothetical protein